MSASLELKRQKDELAVPFDLKRHGPLWFQAIEQASQLDDGGYRCSVDRIVGVIPCTRMYKRARNGEPEPLAPDRRVSLHLHHRIVRIRLARNRAHDAHRD